MYIYIYIYTGETCSGPRFWFLSMYIYNIYTLLYAMGMIGMMKE